MLNTREIHLTREISYLKGEVLDQIKSLNGTQQIQININDDKKYGIIKFYESLWSSVDGEITTIQDQIKEIKEKEKMQSKTIKAGLKKMTKNLVSIAGSAKKEFSLPPTDGLGSLMILESSLKNLKKSLKTLIEQLKIAEELILKELIDEEWRKFVIENEDLFIENEDLFIKSRIDQEKIERSFKARFTSVIHEGDKVYLKFPDDTFVEDLLAEDEYIQATELLDSSEKEISALESSIKLSDDIIDGDLYDSVKEYKKRMKEISNDLENYDKGKKYFEIRKEISNISNCFRNLIKNIGESKISLSNSSEQNNVKEIVKEEKPIEGNIKELKLDDKAGKAIDVAIEAKKAINAATIVAGDEFEKVKKLICDRLLAYKPSERSMLISIGHKKDEKIKEIDQLVTRINKECNNVPEIKKALLEGMQKTVRNRRLASEAALLFFGQGRSKGQKLQDELLEMVRSHSPVNNNPVLRA